MNDDYPLFGTHIREPLTVRLPWWARVAQARYRIGAAILGSSWMGMLTRHALITQRARDCITPDGQVILANCAPLAEALYEDMPGIWILNVTRVWMPTERAPVPAVERSRSTPNEAVAMRSPTHEGPDAA